jgi:pyruvate,water dikinase
MGSRGYVRWFGGLGMADVPLVGGKNASLGELYTALGSLGIRIPNGFAVTADAYRDSLEKAAAIPRLHQLLDGLDKGDVELLRARAAEARQIVYDACGRDDLRDQIVAAYKELEGEYGKGLAVAVRSSATAEDLPNASFAGQHESFLNVTGEAALFDACRRCLASIFTDRAISYRIDNGFDHFKVALSVGVMKMVRSDRAASGVMFTLDTETGFRDVVMINAAYGLGETVVQGAVDPDEFYVHKPTCAAGYRSIVRRSVGAKQIKMVLGPRGERPATRTVATTGAERERLSLSDDEVLSLARDAIRIEEHYSRLAGHPMPMDIEWAKDATDEILYIVQARPETVASRRPQAALERFELTGKGKVLATGHAVGERIGSGPVRVVRDAADLPRFRPGEVLVAPATSPDWEPVMKTAAAIVTDRGGRTCHAAIIARELGIPAVVGAETATERLPDGGIVTVSCGEGELGKVYDGAVPFVVKRTSLAELPRPRTKVMVNLGNPDLAFKTGLLPCDGVGLARMEFIISEHIRVHPMALIHPERVPEERVRRQIAKLTRGFNRPEDFFVQRLSEGVGTIAAAFYPRPVIVRMSDFKTNEYASLLGGAAFEPKEENPMLGFRGAARYAHPAYAEGFALECAAMKRVRDEMGLTNVRLMIPFCRRVEEARKVLDAMAANGLRRGENGLEIYVMCEIPNNVISIDAFAALFDGFSIGSNDLTQLTLGVDRDSAIVAFDFDERDPGMLEMLRLAVAGARRNGRHSGICGEAPSTYPEIARFLVELGIDSLSLNPDTVLTTMTAVAAIEAELDREGTAAGAISPASTPGDRIPYRAAAGRPAASPAGVATDPMTGRAGTRADA